MSQVSRWLVFTIVAALGAAIIAFPSPGNDREDAIRTPDQAARTAQYKWIMKSEELRQIHSREIARETVASLSGSTADAFDLIYPPSWAGSDVVAGVRRAASQNLARVRDTSVRVVVTLVTDTGQSVAGVPTIRSNWTSSSDAFMPGAITPNSCVIVVRTTLQRPFSMARSGFGGAPCYWFGAYGLPGRGVATWLDSTRNRAVTLHERRGGTRTESYFEYAVTYSIPALKCRAGDRATCEQLLIGAPVRREGYGQVAETPKWAGTGRQFFSDNADYIPGVLLSRIERELGSRRFAQVWKSDKPFPAAFAEVRGEPLGEWIYDFVVSTIGPRTRGPMHGSLALIVIGLAVPALIAIGTYGAARRSGIG